MNSVLQLNKQYQTGISVQVEYGKRVQAGAGNDQVRERDNSAHEGVRGQDTDRRPDEEHVRVQVQGKRRPSRGSLFETCTFCHF